VRGIRDQVPQFLGARAFLNDRAHELAVARLEALRVGDERDAVAAQRGLSGFEQEIGDAVRGGDDGSDARRGALHVIDGHEQRVRAADRHAAEFEYVHYRPTSRMADCRWQMAGPHASRRSSAICHLHLPSVISSLRDKGTRCRMSAGRSRSMRSPRIRINRDEPVAAGELSGGCLQIPIRRGVAGDCAPRRGRT
jgi:hypothetical protein